MHYIARQYQILFPRLPYPIRLLLNLALMPVILLWSLPRALWVFGKADNYLDRAHLTVPDMEEGQFELETSTSEQISAQPAALFQVRGMIAQGNWAGFLDQMKEWDTGAVHVDGEPLVYTGTRASRWAQIQFLEEHDDCVGMAASELPLHSIEELELALAHHHRDPRLAAALARAHEEMAWARRGGDYSDAVSRDGWDSFRDHLERANEVLSDFDIEAENSFLLAAVTLTIALSSEWIDQDCDRVFRRCLALNPRCWTAMGERAFHLLPRWGGGFEQLEVAARQAMAETSHNGAAAYAAFYLGVLSEDAGALFSCDTELFAEGLADMAKAERDDQVFVNRLIQTVISILTPAASVFGGGDDTEVNARRAAFGNAADTLLKDHFHCHVTDVWTNDPQEVWNIAACAYVVELEAGQKISLTRKGGISISAPDAE